MARRPIRLFNALLRRVSLAREERKRRNARGVVLLFHEVHDDDDQYMREFKAGCTATFLDAIVGRLRRDRWDIIPLDQALPRLQHRDTAGRFAVLTFDDGYRNTMTRALPILERHAAPFTIYVPTGATTGELPSWWLGLRALFQKHETVTVSAMARTFECRDIAAKSAAHSEVKRWVRQDYRRASALAETFRAYDVSFPALNRSYFMDETELKIVARHPLASIGAHTESHPALALLPPAEARREIAANRQYLETLLDRPVRHFAYPFGVPTTFGEREVGLAAAIGFETAVTAQGSFLLASHRRAQYRIPRMELSGTTAQLKYRFVALLGAQNDVDQLAV